MGILTIAGGIVIAILALDFIAATAEFWGVMLAYLLLGLPFILVFVGLVFWYLNNAVSA